VTETLNNFLVKNKIRNRNAEFWIWLSIGAASLSILVVWAVFAERFGNGNESLFAIAIWTSPSVFLFLSSVAVWKRFGIRIPPLWSGVLDAASKAFASVVPVPLLSCVFLSIPFAGWYVIAAVSCVSCAVLSRIVESFDFRTLA
jgi:hypothetical protein